MVKAIGLIASTDFLLHRKHVTFMLLEDGSILGQTDEGFDKHLDSIIDKKFSRGLMTMHGTVYRLEP